MNKSLSYKDIILKHGMSVVKSRSECNISTEIAGKKIKCPVFCANMPSVLHFDIVRQFDQAGWFHVWHRMSDTVSFEERGFTPEWATLAYIEYANKENFNFVSISIGVKDTDKKTLGIIKANNIRVDSICIDVALIYNKHFEDYIKWIRQEFPKTYLIAGNCTSRAAILWLEKLGVDCAKVNIGVSSSCRTRQRTGFGTSTVTDLQNITEYPWPNKPIPLGCSWSVSLSDIENYKPKIKIISDGGLTQEDGEVWIGDAAKSICFGADYVMSGALFKNCIDSPALIHGYSGNSTARIKGHDKHIEGTTVSVESNGLTIKEQMKLIEESLRSSVSYAGGTDLSALKNVEYQIV